MRLLTLILLLLTTTTTTTSATRSCKCGYATTPSSPPFTDLFETDFLHLRHLTPTTGWEPQTYNMTSGSSGPLGLAKTAANLLPNPLSSPYDWGGKDKDPGLQLYVRSKTLDGKMVPSAEMVSARKDFFYGSFRVAVKTSSDVRGTCAAFFFYRNDSQEVDLEVLSAEGERGAVHFVVQDTAGKGVSEMVYELEGDGDGYNEFRFDWLPDRVEFFVNGALVWTERGNVPSEAGRIHVSHWSNGNPSWSQGPPTTDAVMTVSYVKAYFNTTNSTRNELYAADCPSSLEEGEICEIPVQDRAPDPTGPDGNETGRTFFFSHYEGMTEGQTIYDGPFKDEATRRMRGVEVGVWVVIFAVVVGVLFK